MISLPVDLIACPVVWHLSDLPVLSLHVQRGLGFV